MPNWHYDHHFFEKTFTYLTDQNYDGPLIRKYRNSFLQAFEGSLSSNLRFYSGDEDSRICSHMVLSVLEKLSSIQFNG